MINFSLVFFSLSSCDKTGEIFRNFFVVSENLNQPLSFFYYENDAKAGLKNHKSKLDEKNTWNLFFEKHLIKIKNPSSPLSFF